MLLRGRTQQFVILIPSTPASSLHYGIWIVILTLTAGKGEESTLQRLANECGLSMVMDWVIHVNMDPSLSSSLSLGVKVRMTRGVYTRSEYCTIECDTTANHLDHVWVDSYI